MHKLGHFVAGEKVGQFVTLGQFVARKMPVKQWFFSRIISGTFCRRGGNGTFCHLGQFVTQNMPVGQFVVGTKCLLTLLIQRILQSGLKPNNPVRVFGDYQFF